MLATLAQPAHTLQDALNNITSRSAGDAVALLRSHLDSKLNTAIELPRIRPDSDHFKYALLILAGYSHTDACRELKIPCKTAEHWRKTIRDAAQARYGFRIEYHKVVQDIMDKELAFLCNRPVPERLLGQ